MQIQRNIFQILKWQSFSTTLRLFKYLEFKTNPIIKKEEKSAKVSVLHNNAKDIVAQAHQEILTNFIII
jgi:hypothetical protein